MIINYGILPQTTFEQLLAHRLFQEIAWRCVQHLTICTMWRYRVLPQWQQVRSKMCTKMSKNTSRIINLSALGLDSFKDTLPSCSGLKKKQKKKHEYKILQPSCTLIWKKITVLPVLYPSLEFGAATGNENAKCPSKQAVKNMPLR